MTLSPEALSRVLYLLVDMAGPIALGLWLRHLGLAGGRFNKILIDVNVRGLFTWLAFVAFWKLELTASLLWVLPFVPVIMLLPWPVMSWITRKNADPLERGALVSSAILGNTATLGGLVCFLIFGAAGFAIVQLYAVVQNVLLVLLVFPLCQAFADMASGKTGQRKRRTLRETFLTWNQVSLLGMAAGACLSVSGTPMPDALERAFPWIVHLSAWINFLPVGLHLDFREALSGWRATAPILPIKFLLLPAAAWIFASLFVADPLLAAVLIVISACPTAINAVICTELYGLKTGTAVSSLVWTTAVFAFAVCPLLILAFA